MARALSTSVFAVLVISVARCLTMPPVGNSLVGCRHLSNSERFAFRGLPGATRSTAQLRVLTWLVSVRIGVTPGGNSAAITSSGSALFLIVLAYSSIAVEGVTNRLLKRRLPTRAAGTQRREIPAGCRTSIRVVTSNDRHSAELLRARRRRRRKRHQPLVENDDDSSACLQTNTPLSSDTAFDRLWYRLMGII